MWNYCTLGKSTLVLFAFDLYDSDSSGSIEPEEVQTMLRDVYGQTFKKSKLAKKIYNKLVNANQEDLELGHEVNCPQFEKFCKTHPVSAILYGARFLGLHLCFVLCRLYSILLTSFKPNFNTDVLEKGFGKPKHITEYT
jgi:hypothetical protein